MKRKIIFGVIFIFGFTWNLYSDNRYFLKCGINRSSLVKAESGIKTGLNIGIGRQWNANKNFTIDLGLSFSQKGFFLNNISIAPEPWEQNVAFYLETINTTIMINYIETPLVLNYHFMLNEKIGLHLLCDLCFPLPSGTLHPGNIFRQSK
jgi:hypothetical protein